jgi:hypothetical protein
MQGFNDPRITSAKVISNKDLTMFRLLAASWFTRRVAGPLSRAIPNPFLRAAAIAGTGILATRLFQKRR